MAKYTVDLTVFQEKVLENDLLDINDWLQKAMEGKINNCLKRLAKSERERLVKDGAATLPASDADVALQAFSNPKYKNRKDRKD